MSWVQQAGRTWCYHLSWPQTDYVTTTYESWYLEELSPSTRLSLSLCVLLNCLQDCIFLFPLFILPLAHSHNSYNNFAPDVELTQFLQISQHPCMLHSTEKREKKPRLNISYSFAKKNKNNKKMWRIETAAQKSEFFSLLWNCRCSNSIEFIIILLYTV